MEERDGAYAKFRPFGPIEIENANYHRRHSYNYIIGHFCSRRKAFAGDYNLPSNGVDVDVRNLTILKIFG